MSIGKKGFECYSKCCAAVLNDFASYHHQTNDLLRHRRIDMPHLSHRICLKVEDSDSAQHLRDGLQRSKLEQQQRGRQDIVNRHSGRLPFSDFVKHYPPLVLVFERSYRDNNIIFAQRDELHWIDVFMELGIVITEPCVVL